MNSRHIFYKLRFFKSPILFNAPILKANILLGIFIAYSSVAEVCAQTTITLTLTESQEAFKNPLMGFRGGEYGSMRKDYIKWNEIENNVADGVQKIRDVCNNRWRNEPGSNSKIIPRIYLEYSGSNWPADMKTGDYSSQQFQDRLVRLIGRLGEVWDNDPRVAYVEMGIFGNWGEQETPAPSAAMQKIAGDAFVAAFKNKLVMVRHIWDMFQSYPFGCYWDSWAHWDQQNHYRGIASKAPRWKIAPMGGEAAYNWGNLSMQPGTSPDNTLSDAGHRTYLLNSIRDLHANHVGWVSKYNASNAAVSAGAKIIQKAFGHRFVIKQITYPKRLTRGQTFEVSFSVVNTGSSPFYYKWPVELTLLDKTTKQPVFKRIFGNVDITQWMPGDNWDNVNSVYKTPAATYQAKGTFNLPTTVSADQYIIALAILDPGGLTPTNRFAITNYFTGGHHPMGYIGVEQDIAGSFSLDPASFNSIDDNSLKYETSLSPKYTLTLKSPSSGSSPASNILTFYEGSSVTINALDTTGRTFVPWTGDIEGDPNQKTLTITMDKSKTIGGNMASVVNGNFGPVSIRMKPKALLNAGAYLFSMPGIGPKPIFNLPQIQSFTIYSLSGKQVRTKPVSDHLILWNGEDDGGQRVTGGNYLVKFQGIESSRSMPITLEN